MADPAGTKTEAARRKPAKWVRGVGRIADNPRAVLLILTEEPALTTSAAVEAAMRDVLEWYANATRYQYDNDCCAERDNPGYDSSDEDLLADTGERARAALATPASALAERMMRVIEAARCIKHWHNVMRDESGMVVSAEHVHKLWEALRALGETGET